MRMLTPQILADLWKAHRAQQAPTDPDLAAMQKFMILHSDMHEYWERLLTDPDTPLEVDGDNLMLHIAIDAAVERALGEDQPPGLQDLFSTLIQNGFEEGDAFHVIAQAMQHEFLISAEAGKEMDLSGFFRRATDYCRQAMERRGQP
ncbi:MAG: DUF1841 family protein [Acidobacteriia bacterium]|nr:DUF1841 family protein [Terriglobia bacterium]